MKVFNDTMFNGRDLLRIVQAARRFLRVPTSQHNWQSGRIRFHRFNGRGHACSGHAWIDGYESVVGVPDTADAIIVGSTVVHEFGHMLKGARHSDMPEWLMFPDGAKFRAAFEGLPLRKKTVAPKLSRSERAAARRDDRIEKARAALKRWTSKKKLAETKLKTWTRKLRALERDSRKG